MQVGQIMTREVQFVGPDTPLIAAARKMRDHHIGFLTVVEGERPVGVITDRDIVVRVLAAGGYRSDLPVRKAMSLELASCFEDQTVEEAKQLMAERGVRRVPVLDRDGRLVGIVSRSDLPGAPAASRRPYRVTFYRRLTSSRGQPHDVAVRTFYVSDCSTGEAAAAAAIGRFEAENDARPWDRMADGYKVSEPQ